MSQVIKVKFDDNGRADGRLYAYNCHYDVAVGDRVIVDSPYNGYVAVTVVETDVTLRKAWGGANQKARKDVVNIIDDSEYRARKEAAKRLDAVEQKLNRKRAEIRAEMEDRLLREMMEKDPEVRALEAEKEFLENPGNLLFIDFAELEKRVFANMTKGEQDFLSALYGQR